MGARTAVQELRRRLTKDGRWPEPEDQFRYDADPEPMGLDRVLWQRSGEPLVEPVALQIGSGA